MPCECGEHSCFCFNVCRCRDGPCECELCTEIRLHSCSICQRPAFLEGRFLSSAYFKEYCCCFIGESDVLPDQSAANPQQDSQDQQDAQDPIKVSGWPPLVIASSESLESTERKLSDLRVDVEMKENDSFEVSNTHGEPSQKTESSLPLGVGNFQQTLMTKFQKATTQQNLEEDMLSKPETQSSSESPEFTERKLSAVESYEFPSGSFEVYNGDGEPSQKTESSLPRGKPETQLSPSSESPEFTERRFNIYNTYHVSSSDSFEVSDSDEEPSQKSESSLSRDVGNFQQTSMTAEAKDSGQSASENHPAETKDSGQSASEKDSSDARDSVPLPSDLHSDKTSSESTKFEKRS
ncbi:uncharacterized protein LOC118189446 [Stegodyphus dumicola]|uniref:uncharacterized protein LOC118189446 n=1 Tax=Stegodyphus dumicola TaxID=202533 RepID=UPI0015B1D32A|nr:uncharacterized protein LOC118189446 [Stegodyphus dumicola]